MDSRDFSARPRPGHPAVILLFTFLQGQASSLALQSLQTLSSDIQYNQCIQNTPIIVPEVDVCATDTSPTEHILLRILVLLSFSLISGPFGRLMDGRGRKIAMIVSGLLSAFAALWICICAFVPYLTHTEAPILLVPAMLLGSSEAVALWQTIGWSYIAITATPKRRSTYFNLHITADWAVWISRLVPLFPIIYILAAAFFLRDAPPDVNDTTLPVSWSFGTTLRSIIDPIYLLFKDPTTVRLTMLYTVTSYTLKAIRTTALLKFHTAIKPPKKHPILLLLLVAASIFVRGALVLCTIPTIVALYTHFSPSIFSNTLTVTSAAKEPLPGESEKQLSVTETTKQTDPFDYAVPIWELELFMTRWSLAAGAVGVLVMLAEDSLLCLSIGVAMSGFIMSSVASPAALLTLQTPPSEMSRVLTGLALIDAFAPLMSSAPGSDVPLDGENDYTLPVKPTLVVVTILLLCASVGTRYVRRKVKLH
ncbi:hypothetical protein EIP91_003814 [Steccherinum ochraceum]|uniref:Major facilitator superfamily (MFS) profile domain-containing protein n=1 Tax=Steccherinum ochraceum TaxID=92696 RepID=A0A4R0RQH2_9APHY|nr:hypothetical protein EIP91_003814 [Steccherinum ochraceum]